MPEESSPTSLHTHPSLQNHPFPTLSSPGHPSPAVILRALFARRIFPHPTPMPPLSQPCHPKATPSPAVILRTPLPRCHSEGALCPKNLPPPHSTLIPHSNATIHQKHPTPQSSCHPLPLSTTPQLPHPHHLGSSQSRHSSFCSPYHSKHRPYGSSANTHTP